MAVVHSRESVMTTKKDQATGRVEQALGDLTDDHDLKRQGQADEAAAKVKGALQSAEDAAEDLVDKVKGVLHHD
jgi:uncharacterized protein YjbJ (UPF0337 family)